MKKALLFFALVLFGTITLTAQNLDLVFLMYADGDILEIKDQDQVPIQKEVILLDCTVLRSDGNYRTVDNQQFRLREGECLDMYGIKYRSENQYRYKIKNENLILTSTQLDRQYEDKYHFTKINGVVYKIKNTSQSLLRKPLTLKNGIVLDPFGKYKTKEGLEEIRLKDGEVFNVSGIKFGDAFEYREVLAKKSKMLQKQSKEASIK